MHGWETRMLLRHYLEQGSRRRNCRGASDCFERDERQALRPLASQPYLRLGARQPQAARRRFAAPTVQVQRRPLREYSEAV